MSDKIEQALAAPMPQPNDALAATVKDYLKALLTELWSAGEPEGEHSKHGCRIGDRLDIALKPKPTGDCMAEFEAWADKNIDGFRFASCSAGLPREDEYIDLQINREWQAWQAAYQASRTVDERMTEKTKHTALPWGYEKLKTGDMYIGVMTAHGTCYDSVCMVHSSPDYKEESQKQHTANADFIILACNSYYGMRSALENLIALKQHKDKYGKDEHYLSLHSGIWDQAKAALNAALEG